MFIAAICGLIVPLNGQVISSGKTLQISITGVPVSEKGRLDNTYSVSSTGHIEMWIIGKVKASGLTKSQLASSIAAKYKAAEIYTNPVFQVFSQEDVETNRNKFVTVGGQVKGSGQKPWTKGMTLYAAIQAAGGETPYGAMNRVKLYRRGKVYQYDMKQSRSKAIGVLPHDIIEVPEQNVWGK